jgi:molybdopterin molybdotransferase
MSGKLLSVPEARARMLSAVPHLCAEPVPLANLIGRVLAQDVVASRPQPPFDASAMDGWAVRAADVIGATSLTIAGESAAGKAFDGGIQPGQAVRIFTGAPLPPGADLVVIQEEAERDGDQVRMGPAGPAGSNIRSAGGDFLSGPPLLSAGTRIDGWNLSLIASAGLAEGQCASRPRIGLLVTGDELVAPGDTPRPDQIFESGSWGLKAQLEGWGAQVTRLQPTADSLTAIESASREADVDILITVGGASVGDHDLVKPALERLGLKQTVLSVAVRPGKPTWFGSLADGRRVLGLPGNPASAFVCAHLFARPLILAWQGAQATTTPVAARVMEPLSANGPRAHYMRARVSFGDDGHLQVWPYPEQDSSLVSVLAAANALLERPAQAPGVAAHGLVPVHLLDRMTP